MAISGDWRVDASIDGDDFMLSVPGASGGLVRTDHGSDVSRVAARAIGSAHVALLHLGFPMVGDAHSDGDHLIVCHILSTPSGGRWDGIDLRAGQLFVYPPGSSQVAADPDGLHFGMVVVPWPAFEGAAAALGYDVAAAARPHVHAADLSSPMPSMLSQLTRPDDAADPVSAELLVDLMLDTVVRVACAPVASGRRGRARWHSRDLVEEVAAWLSDTKLWQVPILTLCREIGVSERRLQLAFRETYDTTPKSFMRLRALQAAHRALHSAEPGSVRIGEVAAAHGFRHGGRFAAIHEQVYGEAPSRLLQSRPAASSAGGFSV